MRVDPLNQVIINKLKSIDTKLDQIDEQYLSEAVDGSGSGAGGTILSTVNGEGVLDYITIKGANSITSVTITIDGAAKTLTMTNLAGAHGNIWYDTTNKTFYFNDVIYFKTSIAISFVNALGAFNYVYGYRLRS